MKIAQVKYLYYFEFLIIIILLPMHTASAKYDLHGLIKNWKADIF